jgi:hypothetical protein
MLHASPHQGALPRGRATRLRVDWLVAACGVLLALAAYRVAAPDAVCGALAPSGAATGFPELVPQAVRDLGLPRNASVGAFGLASILALGFSPSLIGKMATAAVFLAAGVLLLVTAAFGVGIVSCR